MADRKRRRAAAKLTKSDFASLSGKPTILFIRKLLKVNICVHDVFYVFVMNVLHLFTQYLFHKIEFKFPQFVILFASYNFPQGPACLLGISKKILLLLTSKIFCII